MTAQRRRLAAFVSASPQRKRLAIEAAWALVLARLDTLRPARHYTERFGQLNARPGPVSPADLGVATEIGHVVAVTARVLPFRTLCLQQVLAVRRMLSRRNIPATVYLGVHRQASERRGDGPAHAWISVSDCIVNGDIDLERYVVVGRFA